MLLSGGLLKNETKFYSCLSATFKVYLPAKPLRYKPATSLCDNALL